MGIDNDIIPDYSGENFPKYYNRVKEDFEKVKEQFPLLRITSLPTVTHKEIFIYGYALDKEIVKCCKTNVDIRKRGIYILGIYPSEFPEKEIIIKDLKQRIDWSKIPIQHRHINTYEKYKDALCTHHPNGEINELPMGKRSITVIDSAWRLFIQYKKYLKSGIWTLDELPHGLEADKVLKKENKFYR